MEDTPTSLIASKRWKAALAGIATLSGLTAPALGIPEGILVHLLYCSAAILVAVIIGQTMTDMATGGATSGNFRRRSVAPAPDAAAKPRVMGEPGAGGFAALPAVLILALSLGLAGASCSTLGWVSDSNENVAVLTDELAAARADSDLAAAQAAEATAALQAIQEQAAALEAARAAAETVAEQEALQARLDALGAELATAGAARAAAEAQLVAEQAALAMAGVELEAALRERQSAEAAAQGAANAVTAAGGTLLPGAGGLLGSLAMLLLGGAQSLGEARALKRRRSTPALA